MASQSSLKQKDIEHKLLEQQRLYNEMQEDAAKLNVRLREPDENVQHDSFGHNYLKFYIARVPLLIF